MLEKMAMDELDEIMRLLTHFSQSQNNKFFFSLYLLLSLIRHILYARPSPLEKKNSAMVENKRLAAILFHVAIRFNVYVRLTVELAKPLCPNHLLYYAR